MRIFLMFLLCSFFSCTQKSKPEESFSKYLNSLYSSDYKTAYSFLTQKEKKKWKSYENYANKFGNEKLLSKIMKGSSFEIIELRLEGELAYFKVKENIPDFKLFFQDLFSYMQPYRSKKDLVDLNLVLNNRIDEMIRLDKVPNQSKVSKYVMKKEDGSWKIVK